MGIWKCCGCGVDNGRRERQRAAGVALNAGTVVFRCGIARGVLPWPRDGIETPLASGAGGYAAGRFRAVTTMYPRFSLMYSNR
jgi:hypothetical protein